MTEKKKDNAFDVDKNVHDFVFNKEVADVFDDMVSRSVPFYNEMQNIMVELGSLFIKTNTSVYDFGCSTGTTLDLLSKKVLSKKVTNNHIKFIGIDNSQDMIDKAYEKIKSNPLKDQFHFINDDLNSFIINNASFVNMAFTLQFIRPLYRDIVIKNIYTGLLDGGALLIFEKVLSDDSLLNRAYINFYHDYKRSMNYSELEISRKREALENVLVPYTVSENTTLFKRNGFQVVDIVFKWYNWVGFIVLKNEALK